MPRGHSNASGEHGRNSPIPKKLDEAEFVLHSRLADLQRVIQARFVRVVNVAVDRSLDPAGHGEFFQQRLVRYLGGLSKLRRGVFILPNDFEALEIHSSLSEHQFDEKIRSNDYGRALARDENTARREFYRKYYVLPVLNQFKKLPNDREFLIRPGDNRSIVELPTFVKTRPLQYPGYGVIFNLNRGHHYGTLPHVDALDRPFDEKEPRVVWRGSTTGMFESGQESGLTGGSRLHIMRTLDRIGEGSGQFDLGYSVIVQLSERNAERVKPYVKGKLTIDHQLASKYLLSLEGNDVSTALKWMLYSNSCVLMPKPKYESWACEGMLRPYEHYVPVAHDLSDLERVFRWCERNNDTCRKIAKNGRDYMRPFLNSKLEQALQRRVVGAYAKAVRFVRPDAEY